MLPGHQFTGDAAREIVEHVGAAMGQRRGGRRAPKRQYGGSGGTVVAGGQTVARRWGIVRSWDAALWDDDVQELRLVLGDCDVWPLLTFASAPAYDPGSTYNSGRLVKYEPAEFDSQRTYLENEAVTRLNIVYEAKSDLAAASFDQSNWTFIGEAGMFRCTADSPVGGMGLGDWNPLGKAVEAIDTQISPDTIRLVHRFDGEDAERGTLVGWVDGEDEVLQVTCKKFETFEDGWLN